MKFDDFIEGLDILKKYFINTSGYHIGAEHNTFYVNATDDPVSEFDYNYLKKLGWLQNNKLVYTQSESWYCYV